MSDDDAPKCDLCGRTDCPDADLPGFSEPTACALLPAYEALRYDRCDYGCGRDLTKASIREAVRILAARAAQPDAALSDDELRERLAHACALPDESVGPSSWKRADRVLAALAARAAQPSRAAEEAERFEQEHGGPKWVHDLPEVSPAQPDAPLSDEEREALAVAISHGGSPTPSDWARADRVLAFLAARAAQPVRAPITDPTPCGECGHVHADRCSVCGHLPNAVVTTSSEHVPAPEVSRGVAEKLRAERDDARGGYRVAAEALDRFRDVVADCLGHSDENPGDDALIALLREHFGKTGPEPRRWRDFVTGARAVVDQINADRLVRDALGSERGEGA